MSQENIDVVLASIEAYNAEDLDAQMATYAPDAVIVFDPTQALAFGDSLVGREAVRHEVNAAQQFFGARYKLSEVRAAGDSQVLCRGEIGGIGAASGIDLLAEVSQVGDDLTAYGYLTLVKSLALEQLYFPGTVRDESTARFTF